MLLPGGVDLTFAIWHFECRLTGRPFDGCLSPDH